MSRRRTTIVVAVGAAVLAALPSKAAVQGLASFRFERSAVLQGSGPQSLPVDVPLLVGSASFRVESWPGPMGSRPRRVARGGLRDLRFYDAEGREVPYLLVEPPTREPEWRRAARLLPIPATRKQSGFEADLGVATSVDRIHLEGIPAPFLKRLSLDGSGDRARWTRLAPEATLFDLPDSGLRQLELAFDRRASGVETTTAAGASELATRPRSARGAGTRALEASSQVIRR